MPVWYYNAKSTTAASMTLVLSVCRQLDQKQTNKEKQ